MTTHFLIVAIAALLGRGTPSPAVVQAIDTACTEEAAKYPVDARACASLLTVYSAHESTFQPGAVGDSGRSCGVVQMPCGIARRLTLVDQYRTWLRWLRESSLASVDSSARRARHRAALAAQLLQRAQAGVVEAQR